jgi:hypothetical protein
MSKINSTKKSPLLARWAMTILFLAAIVSPSFSYAQSQKSPGTEKMKKTNPAESPEKIAADLADKIKPKLPKAWSLTREKNIITVRRDKPFEWYSTISLPSHDLAELKSDGFIQKGNYTITLEFFSPMSKADVDKLIAENKRITKKYDEEHPREKNTKPIDSPELQKSLHHIPDILTDHYSVLVEPFIQGWLAFFNEQEKKECEGVEKDIRLLLQSKK